MFRVFDHRCVRDCKLKLSRLHALIGPNDGGKSTLLEALSLAQSSLSAGTPLAFEMSWSDQLVVKRTSVVSTIKNGPNVYTSNGDKRMSQFPQARASAPLFLRLDPHAMRQPCELISHGLPLTMAASGAGLAGVYDALLMRDGGAFSEIERALCDLFPTLDGLTLLNRSTTTKELAVAVREERELIPAAQLGDGILYFLAFAVLPYLESNGLLLIDLPEHGLHPARIAQVVRMLRSLSEQTQVVVVTHSPLLLNELLASEVSLITRTRERGTRAFLLSDLPSYRANDAGLKTGDLWLSHSDGEQELALLEGTQTKLDSAEISLL
jgi:predicted ATPase